MPDKIIDYRVVSTGEVLAYLQQGYELYGNMVFAQYGDNKPILVQSLIKKRVLSDAPTESSSNPPNKLRILLVEDNDLIVVGTRAVLEHLNCVVDVAKKGADAIEFPIKSP